MFVSTLVTPELIMGVGDGEKEQNQNLCLLFSWGCVIIPVLFFYFRGTFRIALPPPLSTMSSIHKILEICLIGEGKDGKLVLHWCETRVTSGSVSLQIKLISKSSCISVPCFSCYRLLRKGQRLYNSVRCSVGSGDWWHGAGNLLVLGKQPGSAQRTDMQQLLVSRSLPGAVWTGVRAAKLWGGDILVPGNIEGPCFWLQGAPLFQNMACL